QVLHHRNVFTRWRNVFHGLHQILGFSNNCYDKKDRGERFAKRLNAGWKVREAWIRACQETEGTDVDWATMHCGDSITRTNARNDYWHGKGTVSKDVKKPNSFTYARGKC
ncbi:MAG: DUF6345 domain-containing protein, partial [Bacteroidota bacterium]